MFVAAHLRWQEMMHVMKLKREISRNKAVFPAFSSSSALVLRCGAGRWQPSTSAALPRKKKEVRWAGSAAPRGDFQAAIYGVHQWRRISAVFISSQRGYSKPWCCVCRGAFNLQADVPFRRPLRNSAVAFNVALLPSGIVPGGGAGGCRVELHLLLGGEGLHCLATRYEALVLREAKYSDDPHLHVSDEEWLTFAHDSLDNGFYTIASKAFANALVHIHPSHLESTNLILKKDKINDIRGLQNLAKSLSAQHSVQAQSAEYMKRKASSVSEKCNLHSEKPKLPGNLMFRLGIKTRNTQKLLLSRKRNFEDVLISSIISVTSPPRQRRVA